MKRRSPIIDDYAAGSAIRRRYEILLPVLDERLRRHWAAAEALALGSGGVSVVSEATGLSRTTIRFGMEELRNPGPSLSQLTEEGRVRKRGAGRKAIEDQDETIARDLEALLESFQEEGDRPLDWTCKSIRCLAAELSDRGRNVSYRTVGNLLHRLGYRFSPGESYKKNSIESRREQYRLLSRQVGASLGAGEPVLSVTFTEAADVSGADDALGQPASPDQGAARLAVAAVHSWWQRSGSTRYRGRKVLLVADAAAQCGGDQEIWVSPLRELAEDVTLEVTMVHVPPGARRWRNLQPEGRLSFGCAAPGRPAGVLTVVLDLVLPGEGS